MARLAAEDGVRVVVATPHHADGLHCNPADRILAGLAAFRRALGRAGVELGVAAGAEVRLQPDVADMAARGEALPLGPGGRGLLLELPDGVRLADAARPLFGLRLRGVTPVIAHVERLREVQADAGSLEPLLRMGVLTQGTAGVLLGRPSGGPLGLLGRVAGALRRPATSGRPGQRPDGLSGRPTGEAPAAAQEAGEEAAGASSGRSARTPPARPTGAGAPGGDGTGRRAGAGEPGEAGGGNEERRALVRLLRRGAVHFLASDGHDADRRRPLLRDGVREAARLLGDEGAARALVLDNPLRLLRGAPMRPWSPPAGRRFWFLRPPWRWPPRVGSAGLAGGAT